MANGKIFCAYPYVSLFVSNSGKQLPCCYAQNNHESEVPVPNILKSKNTTDLWNSEYIRHIRTTMESERFPAACKGCEKAELLGGESHRQRSLQQFSKELDRVVKYEGFVSSSIRHLDLRLGNKCNLACRMCHPNSSNQLIPEWLLSNDPQDKSDAQDVLMMPQWSRSNNAIELLKSKVVDPTFIHFAGGEPSIDKRHEKVLEHLVAENKSQNVIVSYNTNLVQKLSALQFLENFKKIKITASIDGVGALNEYIRSPSKWSHIEKNLLDYVHLTNQTEKVQLEVNITLSVYNILSIKELVKYFLTLPMSKPLVPVFTIVEDPSWLSFDVLPAELKILALKGIQSSMDIYTDDDSAHLLQRRLQEVQKHLLSAVWNATLFKQFCNKTEFFDQQRNVSLFDLSPQWKKYWHQNHDATVSH